MKSNALLLLTFLIGCAHQTNATGSNYQIYNLNHPTSLGKTFSGQEIFIGGFSGLTFVKKDGNDFVFKTITDRGPNGWQIKLDRPFLLPDYSPKIVTLKTNAALKEISILSDLSLKKKNSSPATGLPNHRLEENPVDVFGMMYSIDKDGVDTESIIADEEDGYWIGEEYGPSLVHVNAKGEMIRRLLPNNELPRIYSERQTNRGFEGIAKIENKLYGFLQSPIPYDKNFNRIVEFDLDSYRTSAEHFYKMDEKSDRIGDTCALPDKSILVVEQNGKTGEKSYKKIYKITLKGNDEFVSKKLILDLNQTPFKDVEKVEGLAFIDKNHIALVNDNDFGIASETNFKTGITPMSDVKSQLLVIELDEALF